MHPSDTGRAGVSVGGVAKSFGRNAILRDITLKVRPGEFLCLLGPSGCGKTTLLRCIAGLEHPDAGLISIWERAVVDVARGLFIPPERRGFGMVFQSYALWPHMTVRDNIAYPLRKAGVARAVRDERVERIARIVGLPGLLDRRPAQLSGGQQQRVALARALVHEPPVLLLDEPLSNLDATLRGQLRRELRRLHERLGTTTVLVTHDQEEAASLADSIAVMNQGRIVQIGSAVEVLERPRTRFVAEFVGFDNFIPGRVVERRDGHVIVVASGGQVIELAGDPLSGALGDAVMIAVHADALRLRLGNSPISKSAVLQGTIKHVGRPGRAIEYEVTTDATVLLVRADRHLPAFDSGTEVLVEIHADRAAMIEVA